MARQKIDGEVFHSFLLVTDAAKAACLSRNAIAKAIQRGALVSQIAVMDGQRKHVVESRDLAAWIKKRDCCDEKEANADGYCLTVSDAARRCGRSRNTVVRALNQGKLHGKKVETGKSPSWRVRSKEVDAWREQTEANIHRSHGGGRPKGVYTKPTSSFGNAKWRALSNEPRPIPAWREERL